jgi:hypothetical protein
MNGLRSIGIAWETERKGEGMKSYVRLAVAAVALASALVGTAPSGASGAGRPRSPSDDLPTFGRPTIAGIQAFSGGTGLEPSLRIDTSGRVYATAPPGSHLWRSLDEGKSFKWAPGADPKLGDPPTCDKPTEGDNDIATDSAGRLYFSDLAAHTGRDFASPFNAVARSDDQGATFTFSCDSVKSKDLDRPWYAVDGDPLNGGNVYLAIALVHGDHGCEGKIKHSKWTIARSPVPGDEAEAGISFGPSLRVTGKCQGGSAGRPKVSPTTHRVFLPHTNTYFQIIGADEARMVRCDAVPFTEETPSGLSCVDLSVATMPGYFVFGMPDVAIDTAGNLFMEWEAIPIDEFGDPAGDALLYWSSSSDEGDTWSTPVQIPTPGLHNNIFGTVAAGDSGRVDIAWYGTDSVDPDFAEGCGGPDDVPGDWSLYVAQTLDGLDPTPTFTAPIVASEHFIHRGGISSGFAGKFCSAAQLGDFFQMQVGLDGEANIVYADTNTTNSAGPGLDLAFPLVHPMFVRQNGGTGVFLANPIVQGDPAATNSVIDAAGDATYDANGSVSHNQANLDILGSSITKPDADHYRITIDVADLTTLAPDPATGNPDTSLDWLVQWFVPSSTFEDGGRNFFAYMESTDGGEPTFWDGEGAANLVPLPECCQALFTYPGKNQITGSYTPTAPGTITIDVPVADVNEPGAINDTLYSVTASTMTLVEPANTIAPFVFEGYWAGGDAFSLIESAPSYDFVP